MQKNNNVNATNKSYNNINNTYTTHTNTKIQRHMFNMQIQSQTHKYNTDNVQYQRHRNGHIQIQTTTQRTQHKVLNKYINQQRQTLTHDIQSTLTTTTYNAHF